MVEDVSGNFFFDFDNGAYCTPVLSACDVVLSVGVRAALHAVPRVKVSHVRATAEAAC